jgi:serine/threonine protein kinase
MIGERYQVQRQLGEGSFAATYLAHDRRSERLVAVKVLDSTRITEKPRCLDPSGITRFRR